MRIIGKINKELRERIIDSIIYSSLIIGFDFTGRSSWYQSEAYILVNE